VIEVYPAAHGWCPPDTRVYNHAQAEKAWSRLPALYGKALASTEHRLWLLKTVRVGAAGPPRSDG
jgi:hypothetical protein